MFWPYLVRPNNLVAVRSRKRWERGYVARIAGDTCDIYIRDWGFTARYPKSSLFALADRFKRLPWQSIPCGLSHVGPPKQTETWNTDTNVLMKILTENKKVIMKIKRAFDHDRAFVKLIIPSGTGIGGDDVTELLLRLGHVKRTREISVNVFPSI